MSIVEVLERQERCENDNFETFSIIHIEPKLGIYEFALGLSLI